MCVLAMKGLACCHVKTSRCRIASDQGGRIWWERPRHCCEYADRRLRHIQPASFLDLNHIILLCARFIFSERCASCTGAFPAFNVPLVHHFDISCSAALCPLFYCPVDGELRSVYEPFVLRLFGLSKSYIGEIATSYCDSSMICF